MTLQLDDLPLLDKWLDDSSNDADLVAAMHATDGRLVAKREDGCFEFDEFYIEPYASKVTLGRTLADLPARTRPAIGWRVMTTHTTYSYRDGYESDDVEVTSEPEGLCNTIRSILIERAKWEIYGKMEYASGSQACGECQGMGVINPDHALEKKCPACEGTTWRKKAREALARIRSKYTIT